MTKQEQFLWIVQTTILANGIELITRPDTSHRYRHVYSAVNAKGMMADALDASELIPADLSAEEAADDFCIWMLENLRDEVEAEGTAEVPTWFVRY